MNFFSRSENGSGCTSDRSLTAMVARLALLPSGTQRLAR
ncbi:Uncharacterised protein [Bordetella pertussis]|nr:Uncharacterised protein [Bordetella pertussis]CFW35810.1 Uncharacterised protein [Bordetella pertussis]CPL40119.1 Uncharacterised protein [Bordetella pertussis]CPM70337.1 Uncharacterised protein [Bordetella pertussis]